MAERSSNRRSKLLLIPSVSLTLLASTLVGFMEPAGAAMLGGVGGRSHKAVRSPAKQRRGESRQSTKRSRVTPLSRANRVASRKAGKTRLANGKAGRGKHARKVARVHVAPKAIPPQLYLEKLNQLTLRPGVVHKFCNGGLNVNVVEVDMTRSDIKVRPYLASQTFDSLKGVEQHAKESGALVAVNANYFKKDGTPLGTIKVDGEWVAGSLFNRVAMGITEDGDTQFARVNLHGILETSNPKVQNLWVNNMNQPRRTGAHLIVYTRRWGNSVTLPYEGVLVGVGNRGEVIDVHNRSMTIPYGGYVLTDKKDSALANLTRGDFVDLNWQTNPRQWDQVDNAISGGPTLIKDGQLFVGLKDEHFRSGWTSAKITRRTACGVTKDKKLILATVEGPHTLWDLAKFLQQMGCVEAMNLDGGGSTTMVVNNRTVTRNVTGSQRKVAATICVFEADQAKKLARNPEAFYHPSVNLTEFSQGNDALAQMPMMSGVLQARQQQQQLGTMTLSTGKPGGWLGMDGSLLPPATVGGVVAEVQDPERVVDIDNDLVKTSPSAKEKKESKKADMVAPEKKPAEIEQKPDNGWTNKILKPFKFGFGSKHRS